MHGERSLQLLQAQRLGQKVVCARVFEQCLRLRTNHCRDGDDGTMAQQCPRRLEFADLTRRRHAVFARHALVHEDGVDRGVVKAQLLECFAAVFGCYDVVAEGGEHLFAELLVDLGRKGVSFVPFDTTVFFACVGMGKLRPYWIILDEQDE